MTNKKVYDVSINIKNDMVCFPGDTPTRKEKTKDINTDGYKLSNISFSVHVGTHVDAPSHFIENGKNINDIKLNYFMGKAQVIEIKNKQKITKEELTNHEINSEKILFKTKNSSYLKENEFYEDFIYLTLKGAKYLVEKGVHFIGIDYITIEELGTTNFDVHNFLLKNEVIILEGIDLSEINPGIYNLTALPLKLNDCEASPVRAVLTELD
ncbi:MAG: cyclase family protein [Halanaerobiales bacterium]|nr:cyclase family protein [Halanaerobiales bacterium]